MIENNNMTKPQANVLMRTVFLSLALYTLPISAGDKKNDGINIKKKPMITVLPKPSKLK